MHVFDQIKEMGHEQVLFGHDPASGLKAIIAIHDTTLGPALGGCRFWNYANDEEALVDVLRLSRGMTYKAAVAGLALGGGKAVIIGDPSKLRSEALMRAFGRMVQSLGGRYITAEDVNIGTSDMEWVALETRHVTGTEGRSGDPSPVTAWGVFHGIRAAVKHKLRKDSLAGVRVAIQGTGSVGRYLAGYLHEAGARLVVADINASRVESIVSAYGAKACDVLRVHAEDVDVFAPCALGAGLNDETIPQIKAPIVAGAANNQLKDETRHGDMLRERHILYAPDYVINAGGVINVYGELRGLDAQTCRNKAAAIHDTLLGIFAEAEQKNVSTHRASNLMAERRVASVRAMAPVRSNFDVDVRYT